MQWFKVVSPSNPPKSAPSDFLICSEFVVSRSKVPHSHQSKLLEPGSIDIKSSTTGGCRDCEVWVWFVRAYSNCLFSYCKKRDMCLWCFLFCAILGTVLVLVGFSTGPTQIFKTHITFLQGTQHNFFPQVFVG